MKKVLIPILLIIFCSLVTLSCFFNKTTEDAVKDYSNFNSLNLTLCKEINIDSKTTISIDKDENGLFYTLILKKNTLKGWKVEFSNNSVDIDKNHTTVLDNTGEIAQLTTHSFSFKSCNEDENLDMKSGFFKNQCYKEIYINGISCNIVPIGDNTFFYYALNKNSNETECSVKVVK